MGQSQEIESPYRTEQWSALSAPRRRHVLAALRDDEELTLRTLAGRILDTDAADDDAVDDVVIDLRHVHLPVLERADLVKWNRNRGLVERTDHPVYRDERFDRILESPDEAWNDVIECLADEERRQVLSIVAAESQSTSRDELADELDARASDRNPSTLATRESLASLHHVHLPKLAAADLVEYDAKDGTVTYRGHPELGENLFDL